MPQQPLASVQNVFSNIVAYLPSLLAGVVVLLLGAAVAWLAAKVVVRLLIWLRLDRIARRLGWSGGLEKGDVRHALFDLVGTLVGALVFLIFLDNALVIWRLTVLSRLLERIVFLVPELLLAVVILLAGWVISAAVANATRRALYEEEVERAGLIARILRAAILVLAATMALVQLDVAAHIITYAFLVTFGTLGVSFVLAFGLGSRRAVEAMWDGVLERRRPRRKPTSTAGAPPKTKP
jgi:hypothetical protein